MPSRRKSTARPRARKLTRSFDPQAFLTSAAIGRTLHTYQPKQAIFSQGDRADTIF